MLTSRLGAIGAGAALAIFAGCAGSPSALNPPAAIPAAQEAGSTGARALRLAALTNPAGWIPQIRPSRRRAWVDPGAKNQPLLYASDGANGVVDIYAYKDPKRLLGQLTGFQLPYGECSDKAGHVYVVDFGGQKIVKYAHGATKRLETLKDALGYPIGCSVDPTTGNLAVANFADTAGIEVYQNGSGQPRQYADKNFARYWPPGYDGDGNLYVEGQDAAGNFRFAELLAGQPAFLDISLDFTLFYPGSVMFDGTYMALTDQEYGGVPITGIYRVRIEGSTGIGITAIGLTDSCSSSGPYTKVVQPWVHGALVVGGNLDCTSRFDYWNYTNGGDPVKSISAEIAPASAYGQTVSR